MMITMVPKYKQASVLEELYWGRSMSLREVGSELGVNESTIRTWMEKHGIDRRGKTEARERLHASFDIDPQGYERWYSKNDGERKDVRVHRLLAVAEYGFDAVKGKDVHHKNSLSWDNRPRNIELKTRGEHMGEHHVKESGITPGVCDGLDDMVEDTSRTDVADRLGVSRRTVYKHLNKNCKCDEYS